MLLSYRSILEMFSFLYIPGVVISSVIIFGPPMLILSMVSPYFTKLIARRQYVGIAAGKISSISTVGSILGTFIPTFLLIPFLGSFISFFISAAAVLVILLIYFGGRNRLFLVSIILIATFLFNPASGASNLVVERESAYNLIKVVRAGDRYFLKLNDDYNIQSIFEQSETFNPDFPYYYMNVAPLINDASTALILGMGAGTSPYQLIKLYGIEIDAVEIDPEIVNIAEEYFGLDEIKDKLTIYVDDARPFIKRIDKQYDMVEVDMYQGGLYAPFYVLTQEFFEDVEKKLSEDGVVVVNVLYPQRSEEGDLLFKSIGNTMDSVFENVFYLNLNNFNVLMFATNEDLELDELRNRIIERAPDEIANIQDIANSMQVYKADPHTEVLTDDKAPLELLTYRVLAEYYG